MYGVLPCWRHISEVACFTEDDHLPNRSEEIFICSKELGCAEGFGASIWCVPIALDNSERPDVFLLQRVYIGDVMYAYIIMHNMIVEDEGRGDIGQGGC